MDEEQIEQRLIVGVGGDAIRKLRFQTFVFSTGDIRPIYISSPRQAGNVSWHQSRKTPASRFKADVHQNVISG
jgi:hypothetical protein